MNLEELFVREYDKLQKDKSRLEIENEMLRWLIDNLRLKYQPEGKDIRAMRVLNNERLVTAEEYLDALGIVYAKRQEEVEVERPTMDMEKPVEEIKVQDMVAIIKKRKGLTDAEIGKIIGVSQSNVTAWRNGKIRPRHEKRMKLMELFKQVKGEDEKNVVVID